MHSIQKVAGFAALLLLAQAGTSFGDEAATDWNKAAIADIGAARETLMENSPGAVQGVDAAFAANIDTAYALAMADAKSVSTYAGYQFALRHFANAFQDDHLWVDFKQPLPIRWPGFLLGYRDGALKVVTAADDYGNVTGATLVGCDGASAQDMADKVLTAYYGRWTVVSSRRKTAPYLLVDMGNPFSPRPAKCDFSQAGRTSSITLDWKDISADDFQTRLRTADREAPQPDGGVTATEDGGYWIGIPTLNALNPGAVAHLETLMAEIETKGAAIRSAGYFVIDLRGNSGGNTFVALRVLNAIWGAQAIADARPHGLLAEWRASAQNVAYLKMVQPVLLQMFGPLSPAYTGLSKIVTGFEDALAQNTPLYIDSDEYAILDTNGQAPRYAVTAKPYLLTDGACISSCLNLVDLMLKLPGVVQIGDETGSDTYYLENRPAPLPSGHAVLELPIKLYRHRERLKNESHKPVYEWTGDMADTTGLKRWVATLAKQ
jgi:hypothetical protein